MTGVEGASGPLSGIRILDCTIWQSGPFATVMLSDMGAEVIKVETGRPEIPGAVSWMPAHPAAYRAISRQ